MEAPDGLQKVPDITVDTGAGVSIANRSHFPFSQVEESPKKGQTYAAASANGPLMKNQGQMKPTLLLETGDLGNFTFQNTDPIRKPLLAVSDVNAKGNIGFFDGEKSYILTGSRQELDALRKLVSQMKRKIPLHLSNGTFKMRAWQPESPFGGPGR